MAYKFDRNMVLFSYCAKVEKRYYFGLSTKREPVFISKEFSIWKKTTKTFKYKKRLIVTIKQKYK